MALEKPNTTPLPQLAMPTASERLARPIGFPSRKTPRTLISAAQVILLSDLACLVGATLLSYTAYSGAGPAAGVPAASFSAHPVVFVGLSIVALMMGRAYQPPHLWANVWQWRGIIGAVSFAILFQSAMATLAASLPDPRLVLLTWAFSVACLLVGRALACPVLRWLQSRGMGCSRAIAISDSEKGTSALRRLVTSGFPYRIAGLVAVGGRTSINNGNGSRNTSPGLHGVPVFSDVQSLPAMLKATGSREILAAVSPEEYPDLHKALRTLTPPGTTIRLVLDPLLEGFGAWTMDTAAGTPSVRIGSRCLSWEYEYLKRAFDLVATSVIVALVAPIMLLTAILIKLDSRGPVLFLQPRVGRGGHPFTMLKFRSMRADAESLLGGLLQQNEASGPMFKISNDPRITRVGRIIRKLSIDELPQLFNVLAGTMSLVGPRPPLPREVSQYEPWHYERLEAVPGVTGAWQVNRSPTLSFDEMATLDITYIRSWSLTQDVQILLKTIPAVLSARGAY